jgi:(1->4)-alpha-D-glucan 1-alpha-D-glucosylmutase
LRAEGSRSDCFVAFQRGEDVIAAVPRLPVKIARDGWADTRLRLPDGAWSNVLAHGEPLSGEIPAEDLFAVFPVALLVRNGVVV